MSAATQVVTDEFSRSLEIVQKAWTESVARLSPALGEMASAVVEEHGDEDVLLVFGRLKERRAGGSSDWIPSKKK